MRKVFIYSFYLLLNILLLAHSANAFDKTYAVVVAVADYKNFGTGSGDLRYTTNDAKLFADFLMSKNGGSGPASNIYLLTNEKAKKENILYYTKKMFSRAQTNDRVIFFFSGHGDKGVFLPYDVTSSGGNLLYFSEVQALFRYANCKTKLLFADACYSGSIKEKSATNSNFKKALTKEATVKSSSGTNIAVMLSSSKNETSLEAGDLKQGLFSYYVIKGLRGSADDNNNSFITIKELFYYVYENTTREASNSGQSQTPVLFGDFNLNLVVGVVK